MTEAEKYARIFRAAADGILDALGVVTFADGMQVENPTAEQRIRSVFGSQWMSQTAAYTDGAKTAGMFLGVAHIYEKIAEAEMPAPAQTIGYVIPPPSSL